MILYLLLSISIGSSIALVDFTNSVLYDLYDFKGVYEVPISKCDSGCLIFAATVGEGFIQFPDGLEPYANSLYVHDKSRGSEYSIAKLAQKRDEKQRKIPLKIDGKSTISVINRNGKNGDKLMEHALLLYVVDKSKAAEFSYEVYDTYYTNGTTITPQSDIVTFISAKYFRLNAQPNDQSSSVTARLVGFDNSLDNNVDNCPYALNMTAYQTINGFSIQSSSPIISLVMGKRNSLHLQPDFKFSTYRDIGVDGFLSSPGWNGCSKTNNGGFQSFRTPDDYPTDTYYLTNSYDDFRVTIEVLPNFDANHTVIIDDMRSFNEPMIVRGTIHQRLVFPYTRYLLIDFKDMKKDQGFLLTYSSELIQKSTDRVDSTTGSTTSTDCTTGSTTSTQPLTTTSAVSMATVDGLSMLLLIAAVRGS